MPTLTAEERVGSLLGQKYRLLRVIARGGMGVLFEGRHAWTRRKVAVKLLRAEDDVESTRVARMVHEARAAASIRHANVIDILDMGGDAGAPYVVMEFLEGSSLEEILSRREQLSPQKTLEFLLPIIERRRYTCMRALARALLISARADRVELPEAPDPGGLREWREWLDVGANDGQRALASIQPTVASTPSIRLQHPWTDQSLSARWKRSAPPECREWSRVSRVTVVPQSFDVHLTARGGVVPLYALPEGNRCFLFSSGAPASPQFLR